MRYERNYSSNKITTYFSSEFQNVAMMIDSTFYTIDILDIPDIIKVLTYEYVERADKQQIKKLIDSFKQALHDTYKLEKS